MKKTILKISAVIAGLSGEMSAFAQQNDIKVEFYAGKVYQIASNAVGDCSGEIAQEKTCSFPHDQINKASVTLSVNVNGVTQNCNFYGGKTSQGTPFFTGVCPQQVGTVLVSNTPMAQPNNPIIVHLP